MLAVEGSSVSSGVDLGLLRRITEDLFVPVVFKAFGEPGTSALREILRFLPQHFARANPEHITGTLYIVYPLDASALERAVAGDSVTEREIDRLPTHVSGTTVIELLDTGAFRVWGGPAINVEAASQVAVVYRFSPDREEVVVRGVSHPIRNPALDSCSVFARPTFGSLEVALRDYEATQIRTSHCYLFREAWEDVTVRLFFRDKPEWHMRRSLEQFLQTRLRDADVLPEQVVDETHPVDLKVKWHFTKSEALIEIKWLGKSRRGGKDGTVVAYFDGRARDGAKQLADYLDSYHSTNPDADTTGYLVVIDGRRNGLADDATSVTRENGMYYENRGIEFDPEYDKHRTDYSSPKRMFAEPVCSPEAPQS
jgi:hypothetical protein